MLKKLSPVLVLFLLIIAVWFLFYSSMPRNVESVNIPENKFSTMRAFEHVKNMSFAPHYVGSTTHSKVRNYIVNELQEMGLEVQTQESYSLGNRGEFSLARNILARIPGSGNGQSLLLMSHYDSAGHSSFGASDAASGVATILEGIRAFMVNKEEHLNDIIILITDAEEIGLLGAQLFTQEHPWASQVGLALNFEARGSGGNSFMLLEANKGNAALIREFKKANPGFAVTNSLAYSVYKMLPNDTDLTVLREQGEISGFNFAFIDDHFDYHTANDIPANLDKETLAHQGSYLMPLLNHFKDADLFLNAEEDVIYFSLPGGKLVSYPYSWTTPLLLGVFFLFCAVLLYGFRNRRLSLKSILKGAIPFLISLVGSSILVFIVWQLVYMLYPEYREMLHGFTYNGYWYIGAAILLALTVNLMVYHKFRQVEKQADYFVFPLFFWLLICVLTAIFLEGAAYFIVPAYFAVLQLFLMLKFLRPNLFILWFLSLPALIILLPFIVTFPVALGLKILFVSAILISLLFALYIPVFGFMKEKKGLGLLCFLIFNILFITAHFKSSFTEDRPKPNSLLYIYDEVKQQASWNTYDERLDSWTANYFGEEPEKNVDPEEDLSSKYSSMVTYKTSAPLISIPSPHIMFKKIGITDSIEKSARYSLKIAPNRKINRMELFADRDINFEEFTVNSKKADSVKLGKQAFHVHTKRWNNRLLIYHAANLDTLEIEFVINPENLPEFTLYEASYDLLENEQLNIPAREKTMIPMPFVVNDAVIVKKIIRFDGGE